MAFAAYKIRLRAVVTVTLPFPLPPFTGGIPIPFILEVSNFQSNWEVNGIPTCTLMLPLGREATNAGHVSGIAAIHWVISFMGLITPMEVFAQITPMGTVGPEQDNWPTGWFKVFDGYATAAGYRKEFGNA